MPGSRNDSTTSERRRLGAGPTLCSAGLLLFALVSALILPASASAEAALAPLGSEAPVGPAAPGPSEGPVAGTAAAGALVWTPFTADVFTQAQRSKAPFVLFFSAEWCEPCQKIKAKTLTDKDVVEASSGLRFVLVDMTERTRYLDLVLKSFNVFGAPTTIFFGPDGKERVRRIGFIPAADYARLLRESWKGETKTP